MPTKVKVWEHSPKKKLKILHREQGFQTISHVLNSVHLSSTSIMAVKEVSNIFEEAGIQHITVEKSLISKKLKQLTYCLKLLL